MKVKTNGITRVVFLIGGYAIKIPSFYCWRYFLMGLVGNMSERDIYRFAQIEGSYEYEKRHLLCPVVWASWGGWVLVMKRAKPYYSGLNGGELYDRFIECKSAFPSDFKHENCGVLDGIVVKIDYAQ
jgi:hypothetical protein